MKEGEKKAIEYLKTRLYGNESCKYIDVAQEDLRIFINLVDSLQKENEELKNNGVIDENGFEFAVDCDWDRLKRLIDTADKSEEFILYENEKWIKEKYCIPVQKIKDIIDRIDYDIKKTKEIISNDPKNNYQITRLKAMNTKSLDIKKRLQELLEEGEHNNGE